MDDINLKIAILSDLHCHVSESEYSSDSFLTVMAPRIPEKRHPIQALIALIKEDKLVADAVLCPGDMANKSCQRGLSQAWYHLKEIREELGCKNLLCTLGNHDVDSRKKHSSDPFELARSIHPDFPFSDKEQMEQYWSEGFTIVKDNDIATTYLVINTVADHYDETTALRGAFNKRRLESLEKELLVCFKDDIRQIRVAMMHHHPILHSFSDYTSEDVLSNGDQLMDLLSKFKFQLLIHGHRHQPRLQRFNKYGNGMLVFATGSFSAMLYDIGSTTRNLFHIIDLTFTPSSVFSGSIKSWEFNSGHGWTPASKKSASIPYNVCFNDNFVPIEPIHFKNYLEEEKVMKVDATRIYSKFPDFQYYLPDEIDNMNNELKGGHGIKIVLDEYGQVYELGKIR